MNLTFDVSVDHSSVVKGVHSLENLSSVVSYHVVSQTTLLGSCPKGAL